VKLRVALLTASLGAAVQLSPAHASNDAGYVSQRPLGIHQRDRDRLGRYVPDFAKLQVAGYLGTLGVGVGYAAFDDVLNLSAYYGYTPTRGDSDAVHAAKLAFDVRPFELELSRELRLVPVYIGAGLLYGFGGDYFTRLPARYRRIDTRYYPPTALHWLVQAGLELDYTPKRGPIERHGLYFELVMLDSYLFSFIDNPDTVPLNDALSSSFGYRIAF